MQKVERRSEAQKLTKASHETITRVLSIKR